MAHIFLDEDELGEHAEFILESVTDGSDPLAILLAAEEDPDEVFFAELARLLAEHKRKAPRKAAKRATLH